MACADADSALQLEPDSLKGHLYKGIALENSSLFQQALASFERALALEPQHATAGEGVARCRARRGENPKSNQAVSSFKTGEQHRELERAMGRSVDPEEIAAELASLLQGSSPLGQLGGNATGKVILAHMHREGSHGKPKDLVAAVRLYKEAAEGGSAEGMFMAGQLMQRGPSEVLDFAAGRHWLEAAARQRPFLQPGVKNLGVAEAWHALGNMFRDGLTVPAPDMKQVGIDWAIFIQRLHVVSGTSLIGSFHHLKQSSVMPPRPTAPVDRRTTATTIATLLLQQFPRTSCCPSPPLQAVQWYEKAAAAPGGNAMAENDLGCLFDSGQVTGSPDPAAAATWYRKAADHGFDIAQFNMGCMFRGGKGVPCDLKMAKHFFEMAAKQVGPLPQQAGHCPNTLVPFHTFWG